MTSYPLIDDPRTCWKVAHADRFAFIVDAADYFRAVKRAVIAAKRQVLMIGWDFDTRIELERGRKTIEGPNRLGEFLDWMLENRPEVDLKILKWNLGITESLKRGETPARLPGIGWQSARSTSSSTRLIRRAPAITRRSSSSTTALRSAVGSTSQRVDGTRPNIWTAIRYGTPLTETYWGRGTMRRRASTEN